MTYLATAIIATAVLVLVGIGMRLVWNMELENRIAEAEVESSRLFQGMMDDRVEQVRRYRHDADALLRAIEQATEFGAGRFPLSNTAIELQRRRCEQAGIPFSVAAEDISETLIERGIGDSDLCLVLQNLLDNAYEATVALEQSVNTPDWQGVSLKIGEEATGRLFIEVSNRIVEGSLPSFQTVKVNPEYHGVGLQVVDDIARKYGGSLAPELDPSTGTLTMTVWLQASREAEHVR